MLNIRKIYTLLALIILGILSSCASKKEIIYFQGDDANLNAIFDKSTPVISANDMLSIVISASDLKAAEAFNQVGNANTPNVYTVSDKGTIDFPILGEVKLSGLTRNEAAELIKKKLQPYIVNPGVNITYSNFKITVLGEVNSPGTFTLQNERITILEAIALAGDLTIFGVRKNVMLIRENQDGKKIYKLDLTKQSVLDSPVYYLTQNDVIYVEPNKTKMQSSVVNYGVFISIAAILISVFSILTR